MTRRATKRGPAKKTVPRPRFAPCWSEADAVRIADEHLAPDAVLAVGFRFAVVTLARTPEQLIAGALDESKSEGAEALCKLFIEAEELLAGQIEVVRAAKDRVLMTACFAHGVELPNRE